VLVGMWKRRKKRLLRKWEIEESFGKRTRVIDVVWGLVVAVISVILAVCILYIPPYLPSLPYQIPILALITTLTIIVLECILETLNLSFTKPLISHVILYIHWLQLPLIPVIDQMQVYLPTTIFLIYLASLLTCRPQANISFVVLFTSIPIPLITLVFTFASEQSDERLEMLVLAGVIGNGVVIGLSKSWVLAGVYAGGCFVMGLGWYLIGEKKSVT
jgi:hypothetical protein